MMGAGPKQTGGRSLQELLEHPTEARDIALDEVPKLLAEIDAERGRLEVLRTILVVRLASVDRSESQQLAGDDEDLLTDDQVARMLSVDATTVAKLRKRGELPMVRVLNKYVRVRRGAVGAYVAGRSM